MRYQKIKSTLWSHEDFLALVPEVAPLDPQRLYFYLMTAPLSNILGLYTIKEGYVCEDLRCTAKDFQKQLKILIEKDFIAYDFKNKVVFIVNHLKHNPITNPNQVNACVRVVQGLPKTHLLKALLSSVASLIDIGRHADLHAELKKVIKLDKLPEGKLPSEPPGPPPPEPEPKTETLIAGEKLAGYFLEQFLKHQPEHRFINQTAKKKEASITRWGKDFEKLIRLDKQTIEDIRAVIRWCTADSFWKVNIASGAKFREKWDKLKGKMNEDKKKDGFGKGKRL